MGISGLLPALKSIQTTRHLKEFEGQRIAVDAYVWLHKGIYACATEIATGKPTTRYVEYAMHRVRMLRHYKIEPYIVFDGGPLPAKKGTESERRKRREENLARGKVLAAQGKHSQARDCYLKCVDVTPQMAFQFIKASDALRAESVAYVVAPYEADAQLAYLERIGLVDAIITEDSDLLVFGCQNVLFKLDTTAATVVSISRKDFGVVSNSNSDISLVGWTDVQFRTMAILSGCDYLASIPGIGLKRACGLVRKWKTAEQVIKAVMLEGKKAVPVDYASKFKLAEKCFLHQRVYCPLEERLVHMTPVDADWTKEFDEYCGSDLEPGLAKLLALGDVDPAQYIPMVDINTGFKPQPLNKIPMTTTNIGKKGKGKAVDMSGKPKASGGILNFFGPNAIIPSRTKAVLPMKPPSLTMAGKASGKRTLVEIADQDHAARKKHKPRQSTPAMLGQSKFFMAQGSPDRDRSASVPRRHSMDSHSQPGPSHLYQAEKENMVPEDWEPVDDDDEDMDSSGLSICAIKQDNSDADLDIDPSPTVEQEDGYISPMQPSSPVNRGQDISSPLHTSQQSIQDDFGDPVSSPASARKHQRVVVPRHPSRSPRTTTPHSDNDDDGSFPTPMTSRKVSLKTGVLRAGKILPVDTPTPVSRSYVLHATTAPAGMSGTCGSDLLPDDPFGADPDFCDDAGGVGDSSGEATPPSPSPNTPASAQEEKAVSIFIDVDEFDLYDAEEMEARAALERTKAVAEGWRNKWALGASLSQPGTQKKTTKVSEEVSSVKGKERVKGKGKVKRASLSPMRLKRSNTNVTPAGRQTFMKKSATTGRAAKAPAMTFFQPRKTVKQMNTIVVDDSDEDEITLSSPVAGRTVAVSQAAASRATGLDRFRYS